MAEGLGLVVVGSDSGAGCGDGAVATVCEGSEKVDDVGSVVKSFQRFVVVACTQAQQYNTDTSTTKEQSKIAIS